MYRSFLAFCLLGLLVGFSPGFGQFFSTNQGGPWSAPSTWVAGRVPNASDDVVIVAPVQLDVPGDHFIHSLTVEPGGELISVSTLPVPHIHVTEDVVNRGKIEGKSSLNPLQFTIGRALINFGQWRTYEVFFSDTLTHLFRAEQGSFFSPTAVVADNATLLSDRDLYLHGVELRASKLLLQLDHVTFDTTTVYFLDGSQLKADVIVGQGNAIAGDTTSSIPSGTNTFTPAYWDVHIRGTTIVSAKILFMNTVTIEDTLRLPNGFLSSYTMEVHGDLFNQGFVIPNDVGERLFFDCFGNVTSTGVFQVEELNFMGLTTHFLGTSLTGLFNPKQITDFRERVVSSSSIKLDGVSVDLQTLILQPGHDLFLTQNSVLALDTLKGNNNLVRTTDAVRLSTSFKDAIYQDVVLQGSILIDTHVNFEGQVVNQGILKVPDGFQTSAQITARGTFINQGTLAPNNFNKLLFFKLDGDLDNQGDWQTQELSYLGAGPYVLKTDTSKVFQPGSFLAWQGTPWMPTIVVSGSPLRIDGGLVKLKKLVLQPGHDLQLNQHVTLAVDTLEGNGNHIRSDGAYTIDQGPHNNAVIQSVSLEDTSRFNHPTSFSGSIFNQGVMEEASSISWVLTFHDDFHNLGFIIPNSSTTKLRFVLEGDMENAGFWQSGSVDLKGTGTNKLEGVGSQKVAIPDSNNFQATLNAWAMRTGSSYQWEKDGSAVSNGGHLSGATTSILSFSKVAPGDYGSYRCRIDSSGQTIFSRDVIIGDVLTGIEPEDGGLPGVSALPTRFELGQNYPNPFNPTTTIPYALPQASPVRLVLYDALGRQVAVLVDGHQAAGRHQVRLDASQLAAGIYFYRLQAGPFVQMKKLVLIK